MQMEVSFSREETLRGVNVKIKKSGLNFFLFFPSHFYFLFKLFFFFLFLELKVSIRMEIPPSYISHSDRNSHKS